uniref:Uncharacterized protein n=1 Tax=Arundo donax TaxID=35708 RepID=A0A0A9B3H6_ARUDO
MYTGLVSSWCVHSKRCLTCELWYHRLVYLDVLSRCSGGIGHYETTD